MAMLTSRQLSEWEAYNELDPIGSWRDDFRISYLIMMIVNIALATNGKEGAKPKKIDDFLLIWDEELRENIKKSQTIDQMKEVLSEIANYQNELVATNQKSEK